MVVFDTEQRLITSNDPGLADKPASPGSMGFRRIGTRGRGNGMAWHPERDIRDCDIGPFVAVCEALSLLNLPNSSKAAHLMHYLH